VQGKSRTVNGKELSVPREEWICVPNTHGSVVSQELFDRVQERLLRRSERDKAVRSAAVTYSPHLFKGKVFCAHCGHPMHRHRQNKDGVYWYRCESQWKIHKDACYQVSVKEDELKAEILALLRKHAEAILGGYIYRERMTPVKNAAAETELAKINRELASSGHFLKSLYESLMDEIITADEFAAMKADYEGEIGTLSKRADQIRARRRERRDKREAYQDFSDAVSEALAERELTADTAQRLVDRILVRRDKSFEIVFRFKDEFREVKCVG